MPDVSFITIVALITLAALPVFALGLSALNLLVWPRGKTSARFDGELSVLIPARNEQANIEQCVRAIFEAGDPISEVVVYEDCSTDETPQILERLAGEFPKLRVLKGQPLPAGWIGKPHACARLAEASRGDVLLMLDADTFLKPGAINRLAFVQTRYDAAMVSALPEQLTGSFFERLILPLLHLSYTCWLPLPLIWKSHDPRFLAVNGQVMLIQRAALEEVGGFESVRAEIVDDMAIARRFKEEKKRVVFADGFEIAACRMYRSGREVWEGFSKNIFEGMGASALVLCFVVFLYLSTFVVPYVAATSLALSGQTAGIWWWTALAGVGANLVLRAMMALRFRQPLEGILLHPVAVLGLISIALNSFRWSRQNTVHWSGRSYGGKKQRNTSLESAVSVPARVAESVNQKPLEQREL